MIFCHSLWILCAITTAMKCVQGHEDICDDVSCNDRGMCLPDSQYSRGYWCECEDGWSGQDCLHPKPTVTCGDDRITVTIDKALIRELGVDDESGNIYFGKSSGGPQCRAFDDENHYRLIIRAPFSACGTQVIQHSAEDDYTFSNTVVWDGKSNDPHNLIRKDLILLDFKCIYEDTYSTFGSPLIPENNVLHLITERGEFEVSMSLYDDDSFSRSHEYTESPVVTIGTYVFIQIELEHISDEHLAVTVDRCFASQSRDPVDPISTKHILITDRCVNPNDSTIEILSNGESHTSRFKFQMFKWRWSSDDVYLHCEVDICNKTSGSCAGDQSSCKKSKTLRKRREVIIHEGIYDPNFVPHSARIISQGPIHIEIEDFDLNNLKYENEDSEVDTSVLALGLILGMVLLVLGMVGGVYARRSLKTKKQYYKREAQKKQLTSFHFTTESF